ncbi:MAG: amidase [Steroidobacteraceae bacterium]
MDGGITGLGAARLAAGLRAREFSCVELMRACLGQVGRLNPKVNAIVSLRESDVLLAEAAERDAQLARGEDLGPLHGLPQAVKDLALTRGLRTSFGSPILDGVPAEDTLFVERLRAAGALFIGKTNTPEFGLGSQTYNGVFGTTLNAYDARLCAGGSSGGAAVALALRMLPVADGSDMMGSLRNPAAFNNVLGFRPSIGRVPMAGEELFLDSLACTGPMARSVADLVLLLDVMAGADPRAPLAIDDPAWRAHPPLAREFRGSRVGWLGDLGGHLAFEPGVLGLCRKGCSALESLGCRVDEVALPVPPAELWEAWTTLRSWQVAGALAPLHADPARRARLKPEAVWEIERGLALGAQDVYRASLVRSRWHRAALRLFAQFDFLVLPSAQVFPFDATLHWPRSINGVAMDTYHRWMEVVVPASLLGFPVLNLPVGFDPQGRPMGMQVVAAHHADWSVLQLGAAYEAATNWVERRPPPLLG